MHVLRIVMAGLIFGSATLSAGDPQKDAVAAFPELGRNGSPLHKKFMELYQKAKAEDPDFTQEPNWPLRLAKEAADAIGENQFGAHVPQNIRKLALKFPSLYWHVADACLRETSKTGGFYGTPTEFASTNRVLIQSLKPEGNAYQVTFKLHDPDEPEEYWIVELSGTADSWKVLTAWKYKGPVKSFDLLKADLFTGSMKPYFEKELDAYQRGKDFKKAPSDSKER